MAPKPNPEQEKRPAEEAPQPPAETPAQLAKLRTDAERVFQLERGSLLAEQQQGREPLRTALSERVQRASQPELRQLEKEHPGSLAFFFGKRIEQDKESILHLQETYKKGDKIKVDFLQNMQAEMTIGLGDMLPATVRKVSVIDAAGGKRTSEVFVEGVGYYDRQGYIPVFSGYTVIIEEVATREEVGTLRQNPDLGIKRDAFFREVYGIPQDAPVTEEFLALTRYKSADGDVLHGMDRSFERGMRTYGALIQTIAPTYGIPISTVMAVLKCESNFNPYCRPYGKDGRLLSSALGLGQAVKGTWAEFLRKNPDMEAKARAFQERCTGSGDACDPRTDAELGIHFACWYMSYGNRYLGLNVDMSDAFHVYLGYHDGWPGYKKRDYAKHPERSMAPWYARKVASTAERYEQLLSAQTTVS